MWTESVPDSAGRCDVGVENANAELARILARAIADRSRHERFVDRNADLGHVSCAKLCSFDRNLANLLVLRRDLKTVERDRPNGNLNLLRLVEDAARIVAIEIENHIALRIPEGHCRHFLRPVP